ncbi:MAG: solute:sodium symporter family transporter [Acidobacteria bacterium]|nr:solute:sodium symporter family transporter [Acidobacteriota bacterium]MCG2816051.1 solute:sodium symporter family transporter [Candidatus Aminicenantes bacterium]MBU1474703.1 solute:sodium symporter family transporter [Acidobacteriota bacterium]MBU4204527.1 solute:sodium symporter family transporter [Acidobacteriota bacterium]MBU4254410.1 solute:sodium symporter family transporter [Acidobacteriota bacterium]
MKLTFLDISVFVAFFVVVVFVSMYKSRKEKTGEEYFLAGRGLLWPLIGLSLIAANISSEHFVGMSGQSAGSVGLAIASYEWMAAITLVVVAFFFLPKFLKSGIYTIPEFLEYRYNSAARAIMAFYTMVIYVGVTIASVLYSGALALKTIFGVSLGTAVWWIGAIAALYTIWGGLKAVAWADLFQGSALIIGGAIVMIVGFAAVGGVPEFFRVNADKLHMILPADHPVLPWTALVIGLWIPNFYYWGLNQFICQRSLAAKSLRHGQLGVLFAAGLKLIIPFVIVIPGIMAYQLYSGQMTGPGGTFDAAYPLLIRNLIPVGIRGFMFAAIAGAVISSLASMLNSASTIFTLDLYKRYFRKEASQKSVVRMGRSMTLVFVLIGCLIAPLLGHPKLGGIFTYIQEFQGYISPGILAAFIFGLFIKRAPARAGMVALLGNVPIYGFLHIFFSGAIPSVTVVKIAFLNRMAVTFALLLLIMGLMTLLKPLAEPVKLPVRETFDMRPTPAVKYLGIAVVVITICLYIIFW